MAVFKKKIIASPAGASMNSEYTPVKEDFVLLKDRDISMDTNFASQGYWKGVALHILHDKRAMTGIVIVVLIIFKIVVQLELFAVMTLMRVDVAQSVYLVWYFLGEIPRIKSLFLNDHVFPVICFNDTRMSGRYINISDISGQHIALLMPDNIPIFRKSSFSIVNAWAAWN